MITPACIVIYSSDPLLLRTRTMILQNEGFHVNLAAMRLEEVEAIFEKEDVGLVILCHSLSAQSDESFVSYLKSQPRVIPTLSLMAGASRRSEQMGGLEFSAFDGPSRLVETVRDIMKESARVTQPA